MLPLPETLSSLEHAIRRSTLADCYVAIPALLARYVEELERRLLASPQERLALQARALELLEWVGQLVQVSREETLGSVAHLQMLSGYRSASSPSHVRSDA